MRHNIGGCCDCGDEKTIKKSGFCDTHQGFEGTDIHQEITRIPVRVQARMKSFIHSAIARMVQLMEEGKEYNPLLRL
jgi:hypothetical protein